MIVVAMPLTLTPITIGSALIVVVCGVSVVVPLVAAGNALGLIRFGWQSFMSSFRSLPGRKRTWGTVYDSSTKRPVPFAKVQLFDPNARVLETRITDGQGRYGFLTTPESLMSVSVRAQIRVDAAGYVFPSVVPPTVDSLLYGNLYYGAPMTVEQQTLINVDIPVDPVRPLKVSLATAAPSVAAGAAVAAMADSVFWIGMLAVPLSFFLEPNPFTLGTLFLFLGTVSLRVFGITERPFGTVAESRTGNAVPFALITLNAKSGSRVAFTVTDERGRYFLVTEGGNFDLTVHTPANVQPPRSVTVLLSVRKGWVAEEIKI